MYSQRQVENTHLLPLKLVGMRTSDLGLLLLLQVGMQGSGYRAENRVLSVECWALGFECWVLGFECWVLS